MKFQSYLFLLCYIANCLTPLFTHAADDTFRSLFNGKDLSGWDGRKGLWTVEDGAIVGSTQVKLERNTFLIWKGGDVGDFVLKLKMKFAGGNSGIQYRAKVDDAAKHYVSGNQCDIHPKPEFYGMLYSEKTGLGIIAKGGQKVEVSKDGKKTVVGETEGPTKADTAAWNEIEIHAEGNRVIHKVNGKVTVDVTSLQFRRTSLDYDLPFHTAPRRQYVITLSGESEVEFGDGTKVRLYPGHILLAEDTTGQGHISRAIGTEDRLSLFIPLADE